MFYFLNKNKNTASTQHAPGTTPQPYQDMFNPDQSHHFNYQEDDAEDTGEQNDPNDESLASPSNDRKSKTDDLTSSQSLNRGDGNLSSLSKRGELPPVNSDTDIHKTEHKKHVAATQRPPSGKKPRPITAKLRNQAQGEETSEKENSTAQARPKSGKTRPNSGVKRRSIPSRKDSLLKLQGGSASDDDDGTYGKANHDELEDYLVLKTDRSLTIENDDESDEELRILMTKIGDDDPLSSATNIKEIPTLVKENANKDAKGKSPGGAKSHRSDIQHSEISDDVTDYDSTSVDISSDVPQSRVRKSTGSSWPEDTPVPADKNKSSNEEYSNLSNSKSTDEGKKISDKQPSNQTQSVLEIRRKYTPVKIERKTKSVGDMSEKGELIIPDDPLKAIPVDSKASTPKKRERRKSTWGIKDNDTPSDQTESQMSGDTSMRVSRTSVNSQNPDTTRSSRASDDNDLQLNLDENETESTYSKTLRESADSEEIANNENKKPKWHPPWQLKQEVIAHTDAIPVLVIDPSNRWFATGSADHTVKLWDINTCRPKLVIKAHKQAIRAMTFGATGHRQLFTTGDDRQLLCHDVEVNRVTAKFKGQSAVIYGISTYQPSHLLITAARDKLLKIYDTRSTKCIKTLRGHQNTVSCIQAIDETRQIVSGSHDSTLRLWDIGEGRCVNVLQGHVKSVRGLAQHPDGTTILSASSERILAWKLPTGEIVQEIQAENIAINSITINRLGVTVAGGSNGVMHLWDFNSAHRFQKIHRTRVYESQELPICVFATKFDHTGSKLICSDACNVVKIYREAFTKSRPILDVRYVQPSEEIPLGKNYLVPDSPKKE